MHLKTFAAPFFLGVTFARIVDLSALSTSPATTNECYWSGTAPFCAGGCGPGQTTCRTDDCGDGSCCMTGTKKLCCVGGCNSPIDSEVDTISKVAEPSGPPEDSAICAWSGTAPFCVAGCDNGKTECRTDNCGDGACCLSGHKSYCCSGGCPNSHDDTPVSKKGVVKQSGDYDDICDDDEFICCTPDAGINRQCKCIKRDQAKRFGSREQQYLTTGTDNDLCKDKETLCCNPGAGSNDECGCIDESSWRFAARTDL